MGTSNKEKLEYNPDEEMLKLITDFKKLFVYLQ